MIDRFIQWFFGWVLYFTLLFGYWLIWIITGNRQYAEDATIGIIREIKQDIELEIWAEKRKKDAPNNTTPK